jgi:hypothetical protein
MLKGNKERVSKIEEHHENTKEGKRKNEGGQEFLLRAFLHSLLVGLGF